MTGKMKYIGKDKVIPKDICVTSILWVVILLPALFVMSYTNYSIGGWWGLPFIDILFLVPLVNTLRLYLMCSYTEPGIIPRVRSTKIDYNKTHYVAYRIGDEDDHPLN